MSGIFSDQSFKEKHIAISGGAGDIGSAIAIQFAKAGAEKIALIDSDVKALDKLTNTLDELGCSGIKIRADLADISSIENAVDMLHKASDRWDILVTTAGKVIGGPLVDYKIDDWDALMKINARSVFVLSKLIAKGMIKKKQGKIVHIGSSSTYFGTPGSGAYAASKVVVNQLTQTMAVEWGSYNIQVNAICPTVTETKFLDFLEGDTLHEKFRKKLKDKMPLHRLLRPEDIAPTVLFLSSDEAQFINGAIIPLDGGSKLVST